MSYSIAKSCIELGKGLTGGAPSEVIGSSFALTGGIAIGVVELTALTAYICLVKVATFFIPGNYSKKFDNFLYAVVVHTGSVFAEMVSIFSEKSKESIKAFFTSEDVLRFSYIHIDGLSPHIHVQRGVNTLHKATVTGKSLLMPNMATMQCAVIVASLYGVVYFLGKQFENSSIMTRVTIGAIVGTFGSTLGFRLGVQIGNSLPPAYRYKLRDKIESVFRFFSNMKDKIWGTHSLRKFPDSPFRQTLERRAQVIKMTKQ